MDERRKLIAPSIKKEASRIALELLDMLLKQEGLASKDLWQLYESNAPQDKFQTERSLLNEFINLLLKSNPGNISRQLILQKILSMLGIILGNSALKAEFVSNFDKDIDNLLIYTAYREIDIPIVNL